jgi:N-acetylglucosaminyldiphosphoundecaprenol N-acetyl-beta-D-mannosaminyltransferase
MAAARFVFMDLVAWTKRAVDVAVSGSLIILFSPLLVLGLLATGASFRRTRLLGKWAEPFDALSFDTSRNRIGRAIELFHVHNIPILINIFKGDMSFIGPLPVSPHHEDFRERERRKRFGVRPGLISPWWIRKRANIDYGAESEVDAEYVETQGLLNDLSIALRAIPAVFYGESAPVAPDLLTVLGIPIDNVTMGEALDILMKWLSEQTPRQVCFVNADCANIAYRRDDYLKTLREADLCLADGIGLKLAGKILGRPVKQNVNGTDLFPRLCERLAGTGLRLCLLGAGPGVAEGVEQWVGRSFPEVTVCGAHHGYFTPDEEPEVIRRIRGSRADILLVALGAPKQDLWIRAHLAETGVKVAMGVGGLFDFYSGRVSRAPLWMREIGMEWLYRLIQEPGRLWKRYLVGNGLFLWRVLRERSTSRKPD